MDSDIYTTFYFFFIKTHISVFLLENLYYNLYLLYIIQIVFEYQATNVHC